MKNDKVFELLLLHAKKINKNSYSPYSKFKVSCSILTEKGNVFSGVNVENASYGLTVCAERIAIFNAVSHGEKKFKAVLIYTPYSEPAYPCGACLQVISEFCKDVTIYIAGREAAPIKTSLSKLLPCRFTIE